MLAGSERDRLDKLFDLDCFILGSCVDSKFKT